MLLLLAGIVFVMASERVEAGTACVIRHHGKTTGDVAMPGWEWMTPTRDSLRCYPTRVQSLEFTGTESDANFTDSAIGHKSKDGVPVNVAAMVKFSLPPENLTDIHNMYGQSLDTVVEKHLQDVVRNTTREVIEERTIDQIYPGGMPATAAEISERLAPELAERGIVLDSFALTAVDPSDDYEQSVQQQIEQRETAKLESQKVQVEEEIAQQKRVQAQGDADAGVIRAEGVAKENAIIAESITPEILQLEYYEALQSTTWAILDSDSVQPMLPMATPEPND